LNIIFKHLLKHLLNWFEHHPLASYRFSCYRFFIMSAESHLCRRHSP
jgi:hypothetical protein